MSPAPGLEMPAGTSRSEAESIPALWILRQRIGVLPEAGYRISSRDRKGLCPIQRMSRIWPLL